MRPKTIKVIDQIIGQPICFFLTILRFITGGFLKRGKRSVKKVLFIKLIEQGATVLAYSAIKKAVDMVGRDNVYFCVFEENRPILDIMKIIPEGNIIVIRQDNIFIFLMDIIGLLIKSRSRGIDATIDMEFFSRASAILAYLSGAKVRVGLHRFKSELPYRGDLMTHRIQHNPYMHISKAYLQLVMALEADSTEVPMLKIDEQELLVEAPRIEISEEQFAAAEKIIESIAGIAPSKPWVLLNANASDMLPLRKWATERFIELGKRILEEYPTCTIMLTGAPSEQNSCEQIQKEFDSSRIISLAGHTTLKELMVIYSMSDLLITNDSGPGHFASMTKVKTIVMFGPETPKLFGPLGDNTHVIWKNLVCSPCVNAFNHRFSPCTNNVCMQEISVSEVYEKANSLLAG
ncbi:MAG: hypothetical protein COB85_00990 [Bacteroidetes bacterium]|nr:MAG: hypothetical protein COB85_00990 [Bacteroidota bacterium]